MFVNDCSFGTTTYSTDSVREEMNKTAESPIHQLRAAAGLCNAADFDAETLSQPLSDRRIFGDATDQASLRFSETLGPVTGLRQAWRQVFELAFDSKNKFMAKAFTMGQSRNQFSICMSATEAKSFKADSV